MWFLSPNTRDAFKKLFVIFFIDRKNYGGFTHGQWCHGRKKNAWIVYSAEKLHSKWRLSDHRVSTQHRNGAMGKRCFRIRRVLRMWSSDHIEKGPMSKYNAGGCLYQRGGMAFPFEQDQTNTSGYHRWTRETQTKLRFGRLLKSLLPLLLISSIPSYPHS